ncbi:MAG: bifunctional UDP-N-acetylmuramoyl-tripeptide:D-alanyl-D-alanine ligase/alanine racemase [Pseudarcicella sp.]|nr:bifunctional UDP-N-acetylmuramoyl-tripeptide:D-alanyl-D-alanine ligase/alanine racemase [Pseudarcicella sp.]
MNTLESSVNFLSLPIYTQAQYVLIDSRQLTFARQSIFFAIKGLHHDGHKFIQELYQKGVREFVVEEKSLDDKIIATLQSFQNVKIWKVESSILALQDLAKIHREKFSFPVIAITGSNGKTIVKEWLSTLLKNDYKVIKSPKSYNSQVGVPLSVWQMSIHHTLGIFEAGISMPDEMEKIARVIQPNWGILTNIGSAHNEFFESEKTKLQEKLKLFKNAQKIIFNSDNDLILSELNNSKLTAQKISWGKNNTSTYQVLTEKKDKIVIIRINNKYTFKTGFLDQASLENLLHCIVVMLEMGFEQDKIQLKIDTLKPISMRLELKEGVEKNYLIDDTYNNDVVGLRMAINFLSQQNQRLNKVLIISPLLESGIDEAVLYQQIAQLIQENGVNQLIGIGDIFSKYKSYFSDKSCFFDKTEDFLASEAFKNIKESIVLIKGARSFAFEKIVNKMLAKTHRTTLEINLDALTNNLNFFKKKIGLNTQMMVMVKAFAYGSGSLEVANLLQYHGVAYLAVAYTDEGVFLRQNGIYLPIMVMNPTSNDFDKIIEYNLEPEIYSPTILKVFMDFLAENQKTAKIHLKIDTGMHRLGFEKNQINELVENINSIDCFQIASIFSHLAAAEDPAFNDFTNQQLIDFTEIAEQIIYYIGYRPMLHIANSAAIAVHPKAKFDMVRLGIGLYGVATNSVEQAQLETVGTLKTVVSQIKHTDVGQSIGYGRKGEITQPTQTATLAIGYADGYDRRFGNGNGSLLVNGVLCKTIGNICMDMTMVDVSGVDVNEGDEVMVFGENLSIIDLAKKINTIPYEILTNVSERVKRVYFQT